MVQHLSNCVPSSLTFRRNSGSRLPASPRGSPLRHGGEVDTERTQGTQPVHGDRPWDRTHSGTGALPRPSCSHVAVLQETGPQPGTELGRHHRRATTVWWDDVTLTALVDWHKLILSVLLFNSCLHPNISKWGLTGGKCFLCSMESVWSWGQEEC